MTDKYTDLENALEKATDGPWSNDDLPDTNPAEIFMVAIDDSRGHQVADFLSREDAEFITLARTQVPELLADLKAASEEESRHRKALNYAIGKIHDTSVLSYIQKMLRQPPTDKDASNE